MKLEERGELLDSFEIGGMREIAASARRFSCSAEPTKSDAKRVSDSYASEVKSSRDADLGLFYLYDVSQTPRHGVRFRKSKATELQGQMPRNRKLRFRFSMAC